MATLRLSPTLATGAVFAVLGVVYGSWASRIPAAVERLDLAEGDLGLALATLALGSVFAMPLGGWLVHRAGSRPLVRIGIALVCVTNGVVMLAPSLAVFAVLTFLWGAAHSATDVAVNAHAVEIERRLPRPVLSKLHALFSIGGLAGAGSGALVVALGVDARVHLGALSATLLVLAVAATRPLLPAAADRVARATAERTGRRRLRRPSQRVVVLGALAFAALLVEGSAADWSAVYVHHQLGAAQSTAALTFTAFAAAMAAGRLAGDRLVLRLGPVAVVRRGALLAAGGMAAALLTARPGAAIAGYACLGAGIAVAVPIVYRAAGQTPDTAPSVAMAAVFSAGYFGLMVGPALVGGVAELVGLERALTLVAVLAALMAVLARSVRTPAAQGSSRRVVARSDMTHGTKPSA